MKSKTKNFLIILILFIAIAGVILPKELNDLDEIWNYNFARCIADGLLPYKDFNMVQTPLLPIICGMILKITFNELIVMRILAVILMASCLYTTYKIFEKLDVNKYIINIFVIVIYLLYYRYFCIDYNYAVLLITLIAIYIELKNEILQVNFKRDLFLGILVGTSILFKQTTGLILTLIFILYKLLLVSNKEDFKIVLKIIFNRIIGVCIPVILFIIYLTKNNIWKDFLDYTIYSINTFSNKESYIKLIKGSYGFDVQILSIIVPITILIMCYISVFKKHNSKEQKNIFILLCYSVASMVVIYPISDRIHFLIGALPSIISTCYLFYILTNKIIEKSPKSNQAKCEIKYFMEAFGLLSIIVLLCFSSIKIIKYINTANEYTNFKHFKYIPYSTDDIKVVDDYILSQTKNGYEVYILDASAALFMIPIDRYNKDYDMLLKGNIGANGEAGLIERIKKENENTIFLILNDNYKKNWQTPEDVINFIRDTWIYKGKVSYFDIYVNGE